ncbi:MAG TPA: helix-turn-helix transcriptional regulator [Terriglobia bacterium]|nr:helix-turn-helix transcriptional regulator [Terriglobia bacterium]
MATSRMEVQTELFTGTVDGLTNAHVRRQIQRLRRLKGWTQHDLEQAAGMSPNSIDGLESGLRRINVDTLQRIMEALESDITDVWPAVNRGDSVLRSGQASDPLSFSRLTEIHSLTGAEASCMFSSEDYLDMAGAAAEAMAEPALRTLCAINLYDEERERLCREVLGGTDTDPWVTYRHSENGCSLYLCLKNPHLEFWAEGFVERCLSAWLSTPPM